MTWDDPSAALFLASEIDWDAQPSLSQGQQSFLLQNAKVNNEYTIESLGAMIYLGLWWRYTQAAESVSLDGENLIFEHLERLLKKWEAYADAELGGAAERFQLVDLEVGRNFDFAEVT